MNSRVTGVIGEDGAEKLQISRILVVGAGSVGGLVATILGKTGAVQHIMDGDTLKPENIARHILNMDSLGENKAREVSQRIRYSKALPFYYREADADSYSLELYDIIVYAADDPKVAYSINSRARALAIPVVYVGVYSGGNSYFTNVIHGTKGGCYVCTMSKAQVPEDRPNEEDYGQIVNGEAKVIPGLFTSVAVAASQAARRTVNMLLEGTSSYVEDLGMEVQFFNPQNIGGIEVSAGQVFRFANEDNPDCQVCHPEGLEYEL